MPDGSHSQSQAQAQTVAGRALRAISAFQSSELFMLSAIRHWIGNSSEVQCSRALVRNGFDAADFPLTVYTAFCRLMEIVTNGAQKHFATAPVQSASVLHDEAWLLECLALSQHRHRQSLLDLLGARLSHALVEDAANVLSTVTIGLSTAGFHLRVRLELDGSRCATATHL